MADAGLHFDRSFVWGTFPTCRCLEVGELRHVRNVSHVPAPLAFAKVAIKAQVFEGIKMDFRFLTRSILAVLTISSMCALSPRVLATPVQVRGMFGDRTLGRPITPRVRTNFSSGIRRGPSGNFLGLDRDGRFQRSYGSAHRAAPQSRVQVPPAVRSGVVTRPAPRVNTRPTPMRVQPSARPSRPADIWFRSRTTRGR